jgi:CheY-like chemotaxis protein
MQSTARVNRPLRTPSLLLVDGDPDTRLLYRTALASVSGYITEAEDGAEALGVALRAHPDIVITETRLHRLDGFSLCTILRAQQHSQPVGIIVVTADARPSDAARAVSAGADEVLVKPCDVDSVVDAVHRLWVRHESPPPRSQPEPTSQRQPSTKVRQRERFVTTEPPLPPPSLVCPLCDDALHYLRSYVGGVSNVHPEQWDYYMCPAGCGAFQYRHRTRGVRRLDQSAGGGWAGWVSV